LERYKKEWTGGAVTAFSRKSPGSITPLAEALDLGFVPEEEK
jgi:hypothetical protein